MAVDNQEAGRDAPNGVLTKRRLGLWLVALTVATMLTGGIVGHLATPTGSRYDWGTAAIAATAFGTITLAAFTGALAWTTSGDVTATWELARLSREDRQARDTPMVYLVELKPPAGGRIQSQTEGYSEVVGTEFASVVRVQNVGLGPAIDIEVTITYKGSLPIAGSQTVIERVSTLLHSQIFDLAFLWETTETVVRDSSFGDADFEVVGECKDVVGRSYKLRHGQVQSSSGAP